MESFTDIAKLNACIEDPPGVQFQSDMDAVESQIWLFLELERTRGVTSHAELDAQHSDLFWVARGAVVTAFSALDRLIHALLERSLGQVGFERVRYQTFQSTEQISKAMKLIGVADIYAKVAAKYSKDVMTPVQVKSALDTYYRRKNRITHHADSDIVGNRLSISISQAHECCKFVREFGIDLHSVVFGI